MSIEMTAWLGPAADEMTDEQRDRFARVWDDITTRFTDDERLSDAILSAALQHLLGETDLDKAGRRLAAARAEESEAKQVALHLARLAVEDGMTEVEAARRVGVDRMTLRKHLGK